ncbi:hypothetical protein BDB01DRAFT_840178, partial [Pilobolus umbonatus]
MNKNTHNDKMERMMMEMVSKVEGLTQEVHDMKAIINQRFPPVPTPSSCEPYDNEAKFLQEVLDYTYNTNKLGDRNIESVTARAREIYLASGEKKKKTPGPTVRIAAAFMDILSSRSYELEYSKAKQMYEKVVELSKIVRSNILSNRVLCKKGWTKMRKAYQRYYSLQLETLANDNNIPLYRCKEQWGANLVMAQTMVRESRMDNKETDEDVVENLDNDRES